MFSTSPVTQFDYQRGIFPGYFDNYSKPITFPKPIAHCLRVTYRVHKFVLSDLIYFIDYYLYHL